MFGSYDNLVCGLYKSTNNGLSWNRITISPLPATNIRDIKIAQSASNPAIIYFSASRWDNKQTLGYYKTTNDGLNWTSITPAAPNFEIHHTQGGYNDAICISPVNPNIVFVGGVELIRTTNAGATWQSANDLAVKWHPDQHMLRYNSSGTVLFSCSDGGLFNSTDNGNSWSSLANTFPITQFYSIATPMNEKSAYIGGTQDNGTMISQNGVSWFLGTGNDGAGAAIDPLNPNICFSFTWGGGGAYAMSRHTSNDGMITSANFNSGIPPNSYWWGIIRQDRVNPVYLYTNSGPYIYYTTSPTGTWIPMNGTAFPYEVWSFDVSKYSGSTVVYAALNNTSPNSAAKLRVYDNPTWYERSSGLPAGCNVIRIPQHPVNNNIAYACMEGYSTPGQKIFKTTNRGVNWVNITGNLPNISVTGLVPHPTNASVMVTGSYGGGVYKTTNGGTNWFQWMNGMPNVIYVDNMTWVDCTAINGKFHVVSNSHGRSIWTREITGDDPGLLNLTAFIEGLYRPALNTMISDSITIYLRNSTPPYAKIDSSKNILSSAGASTFTFPNAVNGTNYYIVVSHRNSIETWSKSGGEPFVFGTMSYDFTNASLKAFGNNMKQVDASPVLFGIYSGDVTRDGFVNLNDIVLTSNNASSFVNGYVVTDLTGDNVTNLNDILVVYNNSNAFVSLMRP